MGFIYLEKKESYSKKVKTKYWEKTYKYGIRTSKNIIDAQEIDAKIGILYGKMHYHWK